MIDQDVKKFVLRRLLQKNGEPLSAAEIKLAIRSAFTAALVEGDLDSYLTQMEDNNLVSFVRDELDQTLVCLTPKGKNMAQRLVRLA
jgi:DNA-binding MarR family transcriptional regulator